MEKIKMVGFDMDATLAMYISPEHEKMAFYIVREMLIEQGYPSILKDVGYEAVTIRGLIYDRKHGFILKMGQHLNILEAWFAMRKATEEELTKYYPERLVVEDESRFFIMNTVFHLPEAYMLMAVTEVLDRVKNKRTEKGFILKKLLVTYEKIQQDVRAAFDTMHSSGKFKPQIVANLKKYIKKDDRARNTIQQLRKAGKVTFILTNSCWNYTKTVMPHIMGDDWMCLFDVIMTDADKPSWFLKNCDFHEVDDTTGKTSLGSLTREFRTGSVCSKGSFKNFHKWFDDVQPHEVLYCGDHIKGDIECPKLFGWKTLLVIPELDHEMIIWKQNINQWDRMKSLHLNLSEELVKTTDIESVNQKMAHFFDYQYGHMGSLLRVGINPTYLTAVSMRFADLYTSNIYNLSQYSANYYFTGSLLLLPHEKDVKYGLRKGQH